MEDIQEIRKAVRASAKQGRPPQEVIAVLMKICVEIAQSTDSLNKKDFAEYVEVLWDLNQFEQTMWKSPQGDVS